MPPVAIAPVAGRHRFGVAARRLQLRPPKKTRPVATVSSSTKGQRSPVATGTKGSEARQVEAYDANATAGATGRLRLRAAGLRATDGKTTTRSRRRAKAEGRRSLPALPVAPVAAHQ